MRQFAVILLVFLCSCSGTRKISNQNLAYRYSPGVNFIFPEYRVFNVSKDSSTVYFSVESSQLLFVNTDSVNGFTSYFSVSYKLFYGFESKVQIDSGYKSFEVYKSEQENLTISDHFNIHARDSVDYLLQITFSDLNRQQAVTDFVTIDRTGSQTANDFLIYDAEWNQPIVRNFTDRLISVRLQHKDSSSSKIFMRYFNNKYPLSPPPFSENEIKPLDYTSNGSTVIDLKSNEPFYLDKPGTYHFQFDSMKKEGFTFFYQEEDFPRLTSAESLIESIRFLTTRQEYDKIISSSNRKQAVDDFWLSMAGNKERARILIKSYYSRVQLANIYFTSYMEGWKTDRGLIYIIFGPPASVYRNEESETWGYSQNSYYGTLNFTFDKLSNPFTDNDFKLRRSNYYEIPWYKAVDSWRDGRVVNDSY